MLERMVRCSARLGFRKNDNLVKYCEVLPRPTVGLGAAALRDQGENFYPKNGC